MKLVPLIRLKARVSAPAEIGRMPHGSRLIYTAEGGEFEGERLRGTVRPNGGEWFLQPDEGPGQIDVRLLLETDDDALIYLRYTGVLDFTEAIVRTLAAGKSSDFGDNRFLTQARFESGDPRYAWLNHTIAVGEGRVHPDCVEYAIYEADHDRA